MAEILGLGLTHYPPLAGTDEHMVDILRWTLEDPGVPEDLRVPSGWPEAMRAEWGEDEGLEASRRHRQDLVGGLRRCRAALDAFHPDVVVVWGDDQYENFTEEVIPAFCVLAYDDVELHPFAGRSQPNAWGEPEDATVKVHGRRDIGRHLATSLLVEGFDVAYAYRPGQGKPFPHAFLNTQLFLDYDREGFPYPMLPISVNCYGRHVIARRGGMVRFADIVAADRADPPSPSPRRCFELGSAVARVCAASPWRVALVASSSWSHAFLNDKAWHLYPDIVSDRRFYEALVAGDTDVWREASLSDVEADGQHEMLNWFCLVGAMAELGRSPRWSSFTSTHVLNSNKCFAIF